MGLFSKDLGDVPVPGDATLALPAGRVPVALAPTRGHHDFSTMRRIGSRVGDVEIPTAGDYTVSVAPIPPSDRELYEPTIKLKT